jgi:hypothetical protein
MLIDEAEKLWPHNASVFESRRAREIEERERGPAL